MYAAFQRAAFAVAWALALLGGAILVGLIVLTCLSIIGRALTPLEIGFGPIRGIYDLTEVGIGVAIFAFLPWCHFRGGHATVELFTPVFAKGFNNILTFVFDGAMLFVAAIGTWRLFVGMLDKRSYGETTLIAQIPLWQAYAACMIGAAGFVLVAAFCLLRSAARLAGLAVEESTHV